MDVLGEDEEDNMEMMIKAKEQEKKLTDEEKMMQAPVKLIRQGLKLAMMLSGQNVTDFDKKNINLLSPSLFSLHDQGRGVEDRLSLSKAMKYFDEHGHHEWLNFVVEASGVSDALKKIQEMNAVEPSRRMDEQFRGDNGQPLYFTKENVTEMFGQTERRKIEVFEQLQKSLTPQQMLEMNTTGYAVMDAEQLELIYGVNSPYGNSSTHERLKNFSSHEVPGIIHHVIRGLSDETLAFRAHRERDIVLAPLMLTSVINNPGLVSQPLVLSPLLLVPVILSPAIFGAVILSPWVFVPVIVSPRLMSPVVLSPVVLSPIILSPLALDPLILSPGALLPFILSPSVLSPFILSPVALTPLILSPFCLTPFIGIANLVEQSQRGFSIMTDEQKELIYGHNSPYNSSETLKRLQFVNNSNGQALIEKEIRIIAEVKNWKLRQRDVVASPMVLTSGLIASYPLLNQAVILSPLVLAPVILTPAVLGPVMLGPWVFVPIILAPRLLCPLSINPFIFSPIILSPLVLHPLVLSPGIFNPTILSPLVLSPFVLSPQLTTAASDARDEKWIQCGVLRNVVGVVSTNISIRSK
ncbi:unnamed protein product [Angiostrongylus costaricensis]|uniref:DEP domain-containing protein n=1 Tax=Angiostrongylus costaricensis TaxID=334426 RepID=A0A158PLD4_ANGCS|nr:unnamed protein product [Angiostrongylus costaricensis]